MKRMSRLTLILVTLLWLISCTANEKARSAAVAAHRVEVEAWHAKRIADVTAPNGWVNLVGLQWLEPGSNTFGSNYRNKIVFPGGILPGEAGYFFVNNDRVSLSVNPGVDIRLDGRPLASAVIFHPDSAQNPQLAFKSLRWSIIRREHKLGVRIRDLESEAVKNFRGIDRYPVDMRWKIDARFEPYDSLKTILIENIIGQQSEQRAPGAVVFEWEGRPYRLDALEGRDELFIVFADATTGRATYAGGRFVYVKRPEGGKTVIDFNKAYNPPCVFSPYATCPLPPRQNVLPIEITAGELTYGDHNTPTAAATQ